MNIKGGEFLIKETNASDVFTTHDLSEEQQMMAQAVTDFIDTQIIPNRSRFENKDYDFNLAMLKECGNLGILGTAIPEEYGGLGMGFTTSVMVCDKVSGATGSLATAYGAHTGIGILPIFLYGTEEQKQHYLPKMISGEWIGSYCLTEPEAGSDANSGKTSVRLSEDGQNYIINGQKMWISNSAWADVFIVFARFEGDKNITGFIVDQNPENGITLGAEEHKLGIRASSTRQVFFNDTKVPLDRILGERNKGFKIALNALNAGRVKLAAGSLDAQKRIINNAVKYANERIQFKVPISSFGAMNEKFAWMMTNSFVSDSGTYRAAHDIENKIQNLKENGMSEQESELTGVEEFATECAILKVWCSEAAQHCSDEGIQIYGGMGYSEETPMEAAWRDARITRIYEGTNEINRLLTVSMLLHKTMKGELNLLGPAKEVANELVGVPSFDVPDLSADFAEEKQMLANLKKVLLLVSGKAVQTFMMDLEKHQELILRMANIGIEIYMAESALLAAEKNKNLVNAPFYKAMSQLNLFAAVNKIKKAGEEAIVYVSSGDEQKMMLMGLRRFTKYSNQPDTIKLQKLIGDKVISDGHIIY